MIRVPVVDETSFNALLAAVNNNLDNIRSGDKQWAYDYLSNISAYDETFDIPNIQLISADTRDSTDFRNSCIIYDATRGVITEALATVGVIWTFIALDNLPALLNRWPLKEDSASAVDRIRSRYFSDWEPNKRGLSRTYVSNLWWVAHLTYDPTRTDDPYWLTREAYINSDIAAQLTERTVYMNPKIAKVYVEYCRNRRLAGRPLTKKGLQSIGFHLQSVGGNARVDFFGPGTLYQIIDRYIEWRESRGLPV